MIVDLILLVLWTKRIFTFFWHSGVERLLCGYRKVIYTIYVVINIIHINYRRKKLVTEQNIFFFILIRYLYYSVIATNGSLFFTRLSSVEYYWVSPSSKLFIIIIYSWIVTLIVRIIIKIVRIAILLKHTAWDAAIALSSRFYNVYSCIAHRSVEKLVSSL